MHKQNEFFCFELCFLLSPGPLADYAKGFGGKFGVEMDKVDKSAVGFEYQGKTERHESQKGNSSRHSLWTFYFLKKKRRSYFDHGWSACKQTDGRLFYWHKWCWSDYKQTFNPTVTQASNLFCNFGWKKKSLIWILGSERWSMWRTDGDIYAELILHTGELLSLILIIYYIICDWSLKGVIIGWVLLS